MRKSIVEGDDFSVLPPFAVRFSRALRSMVERLTGKRDEPDRDHPDDADHGGA